MDNFFVASVRDRPHPHRRKQEKKDSKGGDRKTSWLPTVPWGLEAGSKTHWVRTRQLITHGPADSRTSAWAPSPTEWRDGAGDGHA